MSEYANNFRSSFKTETIKSNNDNISMTPTQDRLPRKDSLFKSFNSQEQSVEAGKFQYNDPFNMMKKSISRSQTDQMEISNAIKQEREMYEESDSDEEEIKPEYIFY